MAIIIIFSKLLSKLLNFFHFGGTSLVGKIALGLKPKLLEQLSNDVYTILVTGTNGKTTTCAMLSFALNSNGIKCFSNSSGANMLNGVATAFIQNATIMGKPKCRYAVIECDENSLPIITHHIKANIIVVTNVFRDQLDRYTEISHTLNQIKQGIENSKSAKVFLNADCPLTFSLSKVIKTNIYLYGVDYYCKSLAPNDSVFCPICKSRLKYYSTTFAQLGDFYCSCGYKRKKPNYLATNIRKTEFGYLLSINNNEYRLKLDGLYNIYNFVSSYAVLDFIKVNTSSLSSFSGVFGRMETFSYNHNSITLILVKNPVGFQNSVDFCASKSKKIDAIFCLNDNDADGRDVSWIWDVSFKQLNKNISSAYCFGTRASDMCLRLKYDEIVSMVYNDKYNTLIKIIKCAKKDTIIFATYTAMMELRHLLIKNFGGTEFWQ